MEPLDWQINDNYSIDHIGARTLIINADDPQTAGLQLIALGYPVCPPNQGWTLTADDVLIKEGAPPLPPAAYAVHFGERIYIYPFGFVVVISLDGSYKLFYVKD